MAVATPVNGRRTLLVDNSEVETLTKMKAGILNALHIHLRYEEYLDYRQ